MAHFRIGCGIVPPGSVCIIRVKKLWIKETGRFKSGGLNGVLEDFLL